MTYHRYNIGAIDDVGASPYKISGDPVTALVAQLNRFAGKTISLGGGCGPTRLVGEPFALVPIVDPRAAIAAATIVWRHYSCTSPEVRSFAKEKWAGDGLGGNTWAFVMNNLAEITMTIAQVGDAAGLAPAAVGITAVDARVAPKSSPFGKLAILAAVAIGFFALRGRMK